MFENNPPEFEENKLEPAVFEVNIELLGGNILNPPCEIFEKSEVLLKLLNRDVLGGAFY